MKRCKNITGWTDYPFEELGDLDGKRAPIRHIHVLGYDGNKYCLVYDLATGVTEEIKQGYIYGQRGCCGEVPNISGHKLSRMIPTKQYIDYQHSLYL